MNWNKGNVNVIRGRDNMVRGVELCIFQSKLNYNYKIKQNNDNYRPLQLIVPFEINEPEDHIRVTRSKRHAAVNAEAKVKLLVNDKQQ